jgi:hypothetical protein
MPNNADTVLRVPRWSVSARPCRIFSSCGQPPHTFQGQGPAAIPKVDHGVTLASDHRLSKTTCPGRPTFVLVLRAVKGNHGDPKLTRASIREYITQKRSNDIASHRISMIGGLASPNLNDYRWPDSGASNRQPLGIGFFVVAVAQG